MSPPNGTPAASATCPTPSLHWSTDRAWSSATETLAVEEPLAIEIAYARGGQAVTRVLAVTMRTPGHDEELALGFLRTEGLVSERTDVLGGTADTMTSRGERVATWRVQLAQAPRDAVERVSRGLLTSSACGLCSRTTLEGLPTSPAHGAGGDTDGPAIEAAVVAALPERLRRAQPTFYSTGGTHGAALCSRTGALVLAREDVGRHNAVDKLIGAAWQRGLDLRDLVLVLSGRASFELIQKAAAAGLGLVVAVGAPSSAAVALAHTAGITLAGFVREGRFNLYTHAGRVATAAEPAAVLP